MRLVGHLWRGFLRSIEISTEAFALIWAARKPPEESENEILLRILRNRGNEIMSGVRPILPVGHDLLEVKASIGESQENNAIKPEEKMFGKVRWVDDVRAALVALGGKASLHAIYKEVERVRRAAGRTIPKTLDAVIRRTLEDHSSDSANFRGADLFCLPEGHGKGIWALRR